MDVDKNQLTKIVCDYIKKVDVEQGYSDKSIEKIVDIFFNKVFKALKKEKFFRGNREKTNRKEEFLIKNERTLNKGGVFEKIIVGALSEYFYEKVAENRTREVFRIIQLSDRKDFLPIFLEYFEKILKDDIKKWNYTSLNNFAGNGKRNALFESFFVNKFLGGVKSIKEYINIHRDFFEKKLDISSEEFEKKILKTLYFKKSKLDEFGPDKNKRRVFSKEEKSVSFVEFFTKQLNKNECWGPTGLDSLKASNSGNIGVSIRNEMSKIKNLKDKNKFIKYLLILKLGKKEGGSLYEKGIEYFDPLGRERRIKSNERRSLGYLLSTDKRMEIIYGNIKNNNKKTRVLYRELYKESLVLEALDEYVKDKLGGSAELKKLLSRCLPSEIMKNEDFFIKICAP